MEQVLRRLDNSPVITHPDLLVGIEAADDAGVFVLPSGDAILQTVDFFAPVVDEAFDWGRIAAANALSDVYAMGGRPLTALQLVGWPRDHLPFTLLGDVIEGGTSVLEEAGCVLVGGHSVDDREPKYGFAVTGVVDPEFLVTNASAEAGDLLVLTKPLGTGIISTGIKQGMVKGEVRDRAVEVMASLNAAACSAMNRVGVHAATDITGFGLLGHLREVLTASELEVSLDVASIPLLEGVRELAADGVYPGGSQRNLAEATPHVDFGDLDEPTRRILADAQTSGGLLIAVPKGRVDDLMAALADEEVVEVAVIGETFDGQPGRVRCI